MEREDFGVHPEQFMKLLTSIEDFYRSNKRCKKCDVISVEKTVNEQLVEIYASYIKSPTVLVNDRIFLDAKYIWPEEKTAIMSS